MRRQRALGACARGRQAGWPAHQPLAPPNPGPTTPRQHNPTQYRRYQLNYTQELRGLGLANLLGAMFNCCEWPTTRAWPARASAAKRSCLCSARPSVGRRRPCPCALPTRLLPCSSPCRHHHRLLLALRRQQQRGRQDAAGQLCHRHHHPGACVREAVGLPRLPRWPAPRPRRRAARAPRASASAPPGRLPLPARPPTQQPTWPLLLPSPTPPSPPPPQITILWITPVFTNMSQNVQGAIIIVGVLQLFDWCAGPARATRRAVAGAGAAGRCAPASPAPPAAGCAAPPSPPALTSTPFAFIRCPSRRPEAVYLWRINKLDFLVWIVSWLCTLFLVSACPPPSRAAPPPPAARRPARAARACAGTRHGPAHRPLHAGLRRCPTHPTTLALAATTSLAPLRAWRLASASAWA